MKITVEIARPAADVFALLTDVSRVPEWQASAIESRADGPLAEGVRIHERRHFLGHDGDTELEVSAFEPGRRLALRTLQGPVKLVIDHLLEETRRLELPVIEIDTEMTEDELVRQVTRSFGL